MDYFFCIKNSLRNTYRKLMGEIEIRGSPLRILATVKVSRSLGSSKKEKRE